MMYISDISDISDISRISDYTHVICSFVHLVPKQLRLGDVWGVQVAGWHGAPLQARPMVQHLPLKLPQVRAMNVFQPAM